MSEYDYDPYDPNDQLVRIEGTSFYKKNKETGVVINTNKREIENARKRKKVRLEKQKAEQTREQELDELRSEMSEIKGLLQKLLEK
jgi:IMP dehydrogenase/GMP reductase